VALILSKEQLNRLLKEDGTLQLYPSHTEDGSPRYTHACVGEPFARIHVGQDGKSGDLEYYGHVLPEVRIAPYIKKIDALEPVEFYPSYFYSDIDHMMFGKLDRFYMTLLKAIHRGVIMSPLTKQQQFMLPGEGTSEKIDAMFYLDLQNDNISIVADLVQQTGFNTDKLSTYMKTRNLNTRSLFDMLRTKWT
jgi:hypothetical protein